MKTSRKKTHAPVDDDFARLGLGTLFESPLNPRKDFGCLEELTVSIKAHGILQPLVVRKSGTRYEIICGHRRFRAAKKAKFRTVPVCIRTFASDEHMLAAMLIENCQRKDIHPMTEAAAYGDLERGGKSVAEIASEVSKSEAHVYKRLRLLTLSEKCRKAFVEDRITVSVAYVIARIPTHETQDDALLAVGPTNHTEAMSLKSATRHVLLNYMLKLSEAAFSRTDAKLLPEAGTCTSCPKKTGNQPVLFDDVRSKETCTDPTCYQAKAESHWQRAAQRAASRGMRVLSEKETKKVFRYGSADITSQSPYVDPRARHPFDHEGRTWKELLGKDAPDAVLARSPASRAVKLIERYKAEDVLKAKGFVQESASGPLSSERDRKKEAARKRKCELAVTAAEEVLRVLTTTISERGMTVDSWRVLLELTASAGFLGPVRDDDDARMTAIADAQNGGDEKAIHALLANLMLWPTSDSARYRAERPSELKQLADLYDIDYAAIEKRLKAEARKKTKPRKKAKGAHAGA